jgi:SAM-dependent methyltransferase
MDAALEAERRRAAWYDAHADRYDRRHPGLPGDVAFYASLASGNQVLEIGCGTGRVTRALAQSARLLYAVDRSRPMLERTRPSLGAMKDAGLLLADAPFLPFTAGFDLVILAYRTVQHLSEALRLQLWPAARDVLKADGAILFDSWHGVGGSSRPPVDVALEPLATGQIVGELHAAGFGSVRSAAFPPGVGEESLSRVWVASRDSRCAALEDFHEFLDTYPTAH